MTTTFDATRSETDNVLGCFAADDVHEKCWHLMNELCMNYSEHEANTNSRNHVGEEVGGDSVFFALSWAPFSFLAITLKILAYFIANNLKLKIINWNAL